MTVKNGRYIPKGGKARKRKDRYKPRPVGRPSDYKPEYCEMLSLALGFGQTIEWFCDSIGISRETFYRWLDVYPQFHDANLNGRTTIDYACKKSILKKAVGYYEWDEKEIIDELGRTKRVRYKRYYEPDTQILLNHANKRLPAYKEQTEGQAKGLFVTEFSKLRALLDPQSTIVSLPRQPPSELDRDDCEASNEV